MKPFLASLLPLCLAGTAFGPAPAAAQPADQPLPVHERPIAPEKNPPGDIPDSQVFVVYRSPLGFSLKVPEGWARRDKVDGAAFSDKYNVIDLARAQRGQPATFAEVKGVELPALSHLAGAVRVSRLATEKLPAGDTVAVYYGSNSEPNPVTGKAIRLENVRYYFWKTGTLVTLTLSAPYGADNADQWRLMARSFRWQ